MVFYFQFPSTHVTKVTHDFSTKSAITSSSIAQLCWLLLLWWQLYQNRCNFLNLNGTDPTLWNCWFSICCQKPPFPMKFMPFFFDPQLKNHLSLAQMSWFFFQKMQKRECYFCHEFRMTVSIVLLLFFLWMVDCQKLRMNVGHPVHLPVWRRRRPHPVHWLHHIW